MYGTANPTYTYTVSPSLVTGDAFTGALSRTTGENVGSYAINVGNLSAGANYNMTFVSNNFTITTKAITVTADANQTKVYGAVNPTYTYTVSPSLVTGDAFTGALSRATGENVGSYAINVGNLSAGANYNVTFVTNNFGITKAALTITAIAKTKVYGTIDPILTYTINTFVNGDDESKLLTPVVINRVAGENVGKYAISVSGATSNNYQITFVQDSLTITKAQITAKADAKTRIYGDANPTFTIQYSGFVSPDNISNIDVLPTASTTATVLSNVGKYPITVSAGSDNNYTFIYVADTLTITQRELIATADNATITYGDVTPTFHITYTTFVNGDTESVLDQKPTITCNHTNAGTYSIVLSGGYDNNYLLTLVDGIYTIKKKALIVTAVDTIKRRFEAHPVFRLTYNGFVNGENESVFIKKPVPTCTAPLNAPAGTYPIEFSVSGTAANYAITNVNGILTILEPNGIEEVQSASISVYPNPTSGLINIVMPNSETTVITIVDMNGKHVNSVSCNTQITIDMSDVAGGVYFVRIQNQQISTVRKVVIQK